MNNSRKTEPALSQKHCSPPCSTPACCPDQTIEPAAACVQAEAVLDVVETLAHGHTSEGATIARNSAARIVQECHHRFWTARLAQDFSGVRLAGSFGTGDLVTPCSLHSISNNSLWVASLGGEKISELSPQGDLLRHVSLPGSMPWGLFQAGQDSLWVCDYASPQLLRVERDGTVVQRLAINTEGLNLRAIQGAPHGNALYLILSDNAGRNRRLARLHKDTPQTVDMLHCPVSIPSTIHIHDGRLYLLSQNPPALLSRPLEGDDWVGVNHGLLPDYLNHFTFVGEHIWLAGRERLIRLGAAGAVDVVINAADMSGYPDSNFLALATLEGPEGPRLFAADIVHNFIHSFSM